MDFEVLLSGIERYSVPQREFCAIQFEDGKTVVATDSALLIGRFSANVGFKEMSLSWDDLSFRIARSPVRRTRGNPNLLPFV